MYNGTYFDNRAVAWDWDCRHPHDTSRPDPDPTPSIRPVSGFSFSEKLEWMQLLLDIAYWSLAVWPTGGWVALPMGFITYGYMDFVAMYSFVEIF